ncbi:MULTISPECIES: DNA-processing protein DprA [unclassified Sedimentibacter]|uniref:DNA-processing protein DprA n=1 Tax=unclassified Sedimentibacter TaxID=2649220 RepID=UPI0027E0990F|nr:DNA-processing protein DprA [Sedimentibacter sp. MB35-C1]WMJ76702.1 DNA-processing protein DprA [Sedimentibacter sp. MB35-C1]
MVSNEDIIRLQLVNGLGRKTITKILRYIENKKIKLNNFHDIVKLLKDMGVKRLKIDLEKIERDALEIFECCKKNKIKIIGIYDERYPKRLKTIEDKPLILYVDGDQNLLNQENIIAIVGSRNPSQEGYEVSSIFAERLTEEQCCIVSGFASGCDESAHNGCLQARGKTIAVIPSGHLHVIKNNKVLYNMIIINGGAIVSELPPNAKTEKHAFIDRNRIVAALSDGIIVIEGGQRGGTSHTVKFANAYNKPVAYTTSFSFAKQTSIFSNNIEIIDSFEKLVNFKKKSCKKNLDKVAAQ